MSKGNMLLGHARGKVGDLVFSRTNGQQVVRSRAAVVKNPRTTTQMIQRIILNTVAQAYSRFRAITDHSFEGVQAGQKTMSIFMKKNIDKLNSQIKEALANNYSFYDIYAFTQIGANYLAMNNYVISQGSLPEVPVKGVNLTTAEFALKANTYQAVIEQYGLKRGDQLTLVAVDGTSLNSKVFHYARIILDPVDENGFELPLDTEFVGADNAVANPNPRNNGEFAILTYATDAVQFKFSEQTMNGAAIIVSRKDSAGNWQRSNATMEFPVGGNENGGLIVTLGDCLDAIEQGGISTLNERYLNNAGTGKLAGELGAAMAFQTVGGAEVSLTSVSQGSGDFAGYIVGRTAQGAQYYIKMADGTSAAFNHYLVKTSGYSDTAWSSTAPTNASDDNTVKLNYAIGTDGQWLVSKGVAYTVFSRDPQE